MAIFKFLPPERTDVLTKGLIRFSPADELNDPFELIPNSNFADSDEWLRRSQEALTEEFQVHLALEAAFNGRRCDTTSYLSERRGAFERSCRSDPEILRRVAIRTSMKVRRTIGVCCLSGIQPTDPRALLLWAHYTHGHKGFCIGLDESHASFARFVDPANEYRGGFVNYQAARPQWNPAKSEPNATRQLLLTKSSHWSYEQEFRFLHPLELGTFLAEPGTDKRTLFQFDPAAVTSVTLGINCAPETRAILLRAIEKSAGLSHLKNAVFVADHHLEEYSLDARPVVQKEGLPND